MSKVFEQPSKYTSQYFLMNKMPEDEEEEEHSAMEFRQRSATEAMILTAAGGNMKMPMPMAQMPLLKKEEEKQRRQCCTICRLEEAKVSHFGVPICTGCRAFFRRSVAQQKTYRCLGGSNLCGHQKPVPNRRVCKFCRFQRCVASGMLKSKEQFQLQRQQFEENGGFLHHSNGGGGPKDGKNLSIISPELATSKENAGEEERILAERPMPFRKGRRHSFLGLTEETSHHLHPLTGAIYGQLSLNDNNNVLDQFILGRRRIAFERMQHFYSSANERQSAPWNMRMAMEMSWKEAGLFNRAMLGSLKPLHGLKEMDQSILFLEYAYCWSSLERVWSTIRNGGHQTRRLYEANGHFWQINDDGAQQFYGPHLAQILKNPEPAIHQAIQGVLFASAIAVLNAVKRAAVAHLDELEAAALGLLMFTRQEVLSMVSPECAKVLKEIRKNALKMVAKHIESCGQNVPERLGQIIGLIEPIQEIVLIYKRTAGLMRTACTEMCFPGEFLQLVDKIQIEMQKLQISADSLCN